MKLDYTDEGVPVIENAIIDLLELAYHAIEGGTDAGVMNNSAAHMIWFLGQNEHTFHAPRLEALYREMFVSAMEDADAGIMP